MTSTEEFGYELKIPKERIAVLIGKKGQIKKEIESATNTKINVDSKDGDVFISGGEALSLFTTREIIKAIGRGFNPDIAKLLLKADYVLEIVEIEDFARNKNDLIRIKGRLIGTEGKARKTVEYITECFISVYGKTLSIIGDMERAAMARKAVEGLIAGSPHGNIYKWLEKRRKGIVQKEMLGVEDSQKES